MDIESLEAANQSLQVDLKLAFKRIGDLQAAIEDEMESDDNDDLINRYSAALNLLQRKIQPPRKDLYPRYCSWRTHYFFVSCGKVTKCKFFFRRLSITT